MDRNRPTYISNWNNLTTKLKEEQVCPFSRLTFDFRFHGMCRDSIGNVIKVESGRM